jgi:hypothetical protein
LDREDDCLFGAARRFVFVVRMGMRSLLPRHYLSRGKRQEQLSMLDAFKAEQRVGNFADGSSTAKSMAANALSSRARLTFGLWPGLPGTF